MLEVLGIQDAEDLIKLPDDIKPADPVTENMMILKQEPVKRFKYQDHEAHLAVHMAAAQDPKIMQMVGQSPFAQVYSKQWLHILQNMLRSSIVARWRRCLGLRCLTKINHYQKM